MASKSYIRVKSRLCVSCQFLIVYLLMDTPFSTKAVILQELAGEAAAEYGYGMAIIDRVRERTEDRLSLHSGSVYPALVALEKEGLIKQKKGGEPGRASYFALTAKGRKLAQEQRELAKIVFADEEAAA